MLRDVPPEKVFILEESNALQAVALLQFAEFVLPIIGPVVALWFSLTSISTILPGEDVLETLESPQTG